jgi:hypothetical protein
MVYFGFIIGFIISKEGKFHDSKKILVILNMHIPTNLAYITRHGLTRQLKAMLEKFHFIFKSLCYVKDKGINLVDMTIILKVNNLL